ncbi:MAG: HAD family hydrolase [Dehalococcoidia bacterium]
MIRAVLFDIGSTLWSSPAEDPDGLLTVYNRGRDALLEAIPDVPAVEVLIEAVEGYLAEWEEIWRTDPAQVMQRPTPEFVADALARLKLEAPDHIIERFTAEVMEASVYTARAEDEEDGMADALDDLNAMEVRLACVSNAFMGFETLERILDAKGLGKHLEFVISSADTGIRKPHEAIYLAAATRLGLAPEEIVYVGDRVSADVEGPAAIGMRGILTHQYRQEDPASGSVAPVAVIQHLRELSGVIRWLNGD